MAATGLVLLFLPFLFACFSGHKRPWLVFIANCFPFLVFGLASAAKSVIAALLAPPAIVSLFIWASVVDRGQSTSLASKLPRVWTGIALSCFAALTALISVASFHSSAMSGAETVFTIGFCIVNLLIFYWSFCLSRFHKVLRILSDGNYPVKPWHALAVGLLTGFQFAGLTMLLFAMIIGVIFAALKAVHASKFWMAMFAGASACGLVLMICVTAYLIFLAFQKVGKHLAIFAKDLQLPEGLDPEKSFVRIGAGLGLIYCYSCFVTQPDFLSEWAAWWTLFLSLTYLIAFIELRRIVAAFGGFARNIPLAGAESGTGKSLSTPDRMVPDEKAFTGSGEINAEELSPQSDAGQISIDPSPVGIEQDQSANESTALKIDVTQKEKDLSN